jgi:alanine dehydrogenase
MSKTIRVGVMPGAINEYAVEGTESISQVLEIAGLNASGYDVKADGSRVTDLNQTVGSTNLILLAKQVKGNMEKTVRVGVMPGAINEYAVSSDQTIAEVLSLAGLNASGYDVKADGTKVTDLTQRVGSTNLVLLAKQVKGNATVRIGVMPGAINEYAFESGTTFRQALETAGLSASGYDVKADGTKVADLDAPIGSTSLILLAKQVKGNAENTVRIGVMPGAISEYAMPTSTTFRQALEIAGLNTSGYDVKADGSKVSDMDAQIWSTNLILLAKQVKGN